MWVGVAGILAFSVIAPIVLTAAVVIDYVFIPAASAEAHIPEVGSTVEIKLFLNSPIGKAEYRRQLIVHTPTGTLRREMREDWGGASRTSIYLTETGEIAILGPAKDDYLVSIRPLQIETNFRRASDKWIYKGAFDLNGPRDRRFQFNSPGDQAECVPTLMDQDPPGFHRSSAYRRRC